MSGFARKQLKKTPGYIQTKFTYWCDLLQQFGLRESRKYKGFHDEPLKGLRKGQRSVRLSKSYRVVYLELEDDRFEVIDVLEVTKHEY
ncbi:MAG: hypothetical protein H6625_12130 [Bdellovibrionaceae bacterium]|nr:hypothetical protein [Pseudobdellovibrionaceae bacterium]